MAQVMDVRRERSKENVNNSPDSSPPPPRRRVMDVPVERRREGSKENVNKSPESSPTPLSPSLPHRRVMDVPVERRRERSKENVNNSPESWHRRGRRDEREFDNRGDYYYDRSRSPPPPRERDYKRRRPSFSPSPPPYRNRRNGRSPSPPPYRDRRGGGHSPSPPPPFHDRRGGGHSLSPLPLRRRSPPFPPYKRSRRDDYQGSRGRGRGRGYRPADRRYGYDYQVGYERETGGRLGYHDERPHGRFVDRSSGGYLDRDTGRDGFANSLGAGSNERSTILEGLKSYKQFIHELEDDILPAEAERRYQEYKSGYIEAQKRAYFDVHKDEEWLKDKYHPTNLISVIGRRNELARKLAKDFVLDLQSGILDLGPRVTPASANKPGQSSEPNYDDEADDGGKRRQHGRGPTKDTDLLSAAPKAHHVSSEPRRVQIDIEQAQELVGKLDSEKGIEDNILSQSDNDRGSRDKSHGDTSGPVIIIRGLTSVKGLEGTELLDTLLTYLWRIHGVDYYGMTETNEAKGLRHVRVEGKVSNVITNGAEWEKKLDAHWQGRLKGQDPLELMTAKEKIDAAAIKGLDPYVRKIRDEKYGWKYGCGAKGCTKLFHATEFVHKHLKLKHLDLVMELTSKVREDLYFQNYMNDENAPGWTPIMQPSLLKEKALRHRLGPDGRVKDDRGNRRDRDGRANGGERFDRSENPQSGDFQSKNVGASRDNPDEHMFDTFGGQELPVAPFSSGTAPPPMLMPVPGAGPLGPFIPAPPEVAMRMMQKQGGRPSIFEGGRLSGAATNGPAPIIALPPAFRQDPRRLRSYQDLDAPEEEVTVIDYRSL
ncbi:serrate RNA effector molecule-like isoform X1 [Lycium ferocissimum]|uniref:serrate RNA effector molecule-like isoform X1 n=1 Tax=Lycium ferocissimum TaxID=112874 RepID=UPI0028164D82|nr:serrate RNA effector molecule-like isoform X1 [Lycium ferocissimum]